MVPTEKTTGAFHFHDDFGSRNINRVIGGFDAGYQGHRIDLATGDTTDSGQVLSIESVGVYLLSLAGLDPAEHVLDASPLVGMLS